MNAANEVAVEAFLKGKISFNDITDIVTGITLGWEKTSEPGIDDIVSADAEAREKTRQNISGIL